MVDGCTVDCYSAKDCSCCGGYVIKASDFELCSSSIPRFLSSGDSGNFVGDLVV